MTVTQRPNILLVMSDQHAAGAAACYGHPQVRTPHLDGLAATGALFDNGYTACPICVPARASFMTGRYAHQVGAWDNDAPLSATAPTLPGYLTAAGYDTVACGRTHFVGPERLHGVSRRLLGDAETCKNMAMRSANRSPGARRASNSHVTECGPGEHWHKDFDRTAVDLAE